MKKKFDLVVIGTGVTGAGAAEHCRAGGLEVAIVDSRAYGGTCPLRGCDPKRAMVGVSEAADLVRRFEGKGIRGGAGLVWDELVRFKRELTDPFPERMEAGFREAGIQMFHGEASFSGKNTVTVNGDELEARQILIASGAWPVPLGIPGEELLTLSDRFMELESLPERIVFVGGGYVAFEFAHLAARAGSRVMIIHRGERPLSFFDPELVQRLVERTARLGIAVRTGTEVKAIESGNGSLVVRAESGSEPLSWETDLVVHAAGRAPELSGLNLEAAGVEYDERGVKVDRYLRSVSNPAVYAAGDAADSGTLASTPDGMYEGLLAARNILEEGRFEVDSSVPASVLFTVPPLARVGMSEEEAARSGVKYTVRRGDTSGWYASRRTVESCSGFKVIVGQDGRILGAHLIGSQAEELANVFILAIRAGIPVDTLREIRFLYPTQASNIAYMV